MSASTLLIESPRARPFRPIIAPGPRDSSSASRLKLVATGMQGAILPAIEDDIPGEPIQVLTSEFPGVAHHTAHHRFSVVHRLRQYFGAALLGAVICGLVFGGAGFRNLAEWLGAGSAAVIYALINRHAASDNQHR